MIDYIISVTDKLFITRTRDTLDIVRSNLLLQYRKYDVEYSAVLRIYSREISTLFFILNNSQLLFYSCHALAALNRGGEKRARKEKVLEKNTSKNLMPYRFLRKNSR